MNFKSQNKSFTSREKSQLKIVAADWIAGRLQSHSGFTAPPLVTLTTPTPTIQSNSSNKTLKSMTGNAKNQFFMPKKKQKNKENKPWKRSRAKSDPCAGNSMEPRTAHYKNHRFGEWRRRWGAMVMRGGRRNQRFLNSNGWGLELGSPERVSPPPPLHFLLFF